jgi:dynein heavy chain
MLQEEFIKGRTQYLVSKNVEVEHAVDDLLYTILKYPLDPHVEPVFQEETKRIKRYYFWYLYQALLSATQNSLNAMKYRVCGVKQAGDKSVGTKPFFEIYLQLDLKKVKLNPSQEEI